MVRGVCTSVLVLILGLRGAYSQDKEYSAAKPGKLSASTDNSDFNVYFAHDFQDDTPGEYLDDQWRYDWYTKYDLESPGWSNREVPPTIRVDEQNVQNKVMRWSYPKGCVNPTEGGGQWEVRFSRPFNDVYFSYRIKFMPGFQWKIGGKIPGLGGGYNYKTEHHGLKCESAFTASLMFTQRGNIVFYTYNPDQKGPTGDSLPWGYEMPSGKWITIAIHVKVNDVGKSNGVLEGYIDGKLIKRFDTLRFRDASTADAGIDFMKIYTFFGGNNSQWASPIDQWVEVDDFALFDFKPGANPLGSDGKLRIPNQPADLRADANIATSQP